MTAPRADTASFVNLTRPPRCPVLAAASTTILGIDIGLAGAVATLTADGALIDVVDMPLLADGPAGRRAISGALLADIVARSGAVHAYVELVNARPGEGAVGAFGFGLSRGTIQGVLAALGVPATLIAPAVWKRAVQIPPGKVGTKDAARAEAVRRFPAKAHLFARVKDDGRAESVLIALAGLQRGRPN